MIQKTVLHVGCGRKTIAHMPKGFQDTSWREVRFDIDPECKPDIVGTLTDMKAVDDVSVDAIYSSHNLEHIYFHEVSLALSEFYRILNPTGFVVITCPDLQIVGQRLAEGKLLGKMYDSPAGPISAFDMLYGHRASISKGQHYMAHRGGFTGSSLMMALQESPLKSCIVRRNGLSLWALATKISISEFTLKEFAGLYFFD